MTLSDEIKLLVCDTLYMASTKEYNALRAKGIELVIINSPEEVISYDLSIFTGLITHPGAKDQSEFLRSLKEYPALKIGILSKEPGVYDIKSGRAKMFSREQTEEIYRYFSS